jgi:hypothetical protein
MLTQDFLTVQEQVQEALYGYLDAALTFTQYNESMVFAAIYDIVDFDDNDTAEVFVQLADFVEKFRSIVKNQSYDMTSVGGDFWLSRNGMGEGFASPVYGGFSDVLDVLAKSYGRQNIVEVSGRLKLC